MNRVPRMAVRDALRTACGAGASADTIRQRQRERLTALVRHAADHVPYYRRRFREANLKPEDIRGPEDLSRLPVIRRSELQQLSDTDLLPDNMPTKALTTFKTSGTTGRPLAIRVSPFDLHINNMLSLRILLHHGMRPWHRKMSVRADTDVPRDHAWHARLGLFRRAWISAQGSGDHWVETLRAFRPHYLFGYGLTLRLMARALQAHSEAGVRPRCVLATSGVLDRATREEIGQGFGCPVFDVYASWEGGIMAWECKHCGAYHVNSDWVILEVLKDGRPARPGEEGEVVITNLHSFGMPFIRYAQGDIVAIPADTTPCAISLPTLAGIHGRVADMIMLPSGESLSPHAFFQLMDHMPGIARWRLTQTEYDTFVAEIVCGDGCDASLDQYIQAGLTRLVGAPVQLQILRKDALPSDAGMKYRAVVSALRKDVPDQAGSHNAG
jgi:phenylacetate-CoA ligase